MFEIMGAGGSGGAGAGRGGGIRRIARRVIGGARKVIGGVFNRLRAGARNIAARFRR